MFSHWRLVGVGKIFPERYSVVWPYFSLWDQSFLRAISVGACRRVWIGASYSTLWGYVGDDEEAWGTPQAPRPLSSCLLPTFQALPLSACYVTPGLSVVRGRTWEEWVPEECSYFFSSFLKVTRATGPCPQCPPCQMRRPTLRAVTLQSRTGS